jgi:hypothetical protein
MPVAGREMHLLRRAVLFVNYCLKVLNRLYFCFESCAAYGYQLSSTAKPFPAPLGWDEVSLLSLCVAALNTRVGPIHITIPSVSEELSRRLHRPRSTFTNRRLANFIGKSEDLRTP